MIEPVDQIVAEPEFARRERIAKVRTIRYVQPDRQWLGRALDAAIRRGNGQIADPRNIGSQVGDILIASRRIERHSGVDARYDLKKHANRIDDFTLRFDAASRQIDHFGIDGAQMRQARAFNFVKPREKERCDG